MIYRVVLIQARKATHSWHFSCLEDAMKIYNHLAVAFDEVNEVHPILLKTTSAHSTTPFRYLLEDLLK